MGVKGLTTSITSKKSLVKYNEQFNLTKISKTEPVTLVIDGSSLIYHLYFESQLDWVSGGEYELFAKFLHDYLTQFKNSNINLVIVFDGTAGEFKDQTKIERQTSNIESNSQISILYPNSVVGVKKLRRPPLLKHLVLDVLGKFDNVSFIEAPFEADPFMAKIAREKNAFGVVTSDSDFMILETNGFIPSDSIKIERKQDGTSEIFVSKKTPQSIAQTLQIPCENGSEKFLLPLFACLLGNDYISPTELKPFHEFIASKYRKYTQEKKGNKLVKKINNVANVISFIRDYHYSKDSLNKKKTKTKKDENNVQTFFREAFTEAFQPKKKKEKGDDSEEVLKQKLENLILKATLAHSMYIVSENTNLSYDDLFKKKEELEKKEEKKEEKEEKKEKEDKKEEKKKKNQPKKKKGVQLDVLMDSELNEDLHNVEPDEEELIQQVKKQEEQMKPKEEKPEKEIEIQHEVIEDEVSKEEEQEEEIVEEEEKKEVKVVLEPLKPLKGTSTILLHYYKSKENLIEAFKKGDLYGLFEVLYQNRVFYDVDVESNTTSSIDLWTTFRKRFYSFLLFSVGDFKDETVVIREFFAKESKYEAHDMSITETDFKNEFGDSKFDDAKKTFLQVWKYEPKTDLSEKYFPLLAVLRRFLVLRKGTIKAWQFDCLLATLCMKDIEEASKPETFGEKSGEKRNKFISIEMNDISTEFQLGLKYALMLNHSLGCPFKNMNDLIYLFSGFRFQSFFAKGQSFMKDKTEYNIGQMMNLLQIPTPAKNRIAAIRKEIFRELK